MSRKTNLTETTLTSIDILWGDTISFLIMYNLYDNKSSPKLLKWDEASFRTGNTGPAIRTIQR